MIMAVNTASSTSCTESYCSSESSSKLYVFLHDRDTLRVKRAEICVFEQMDKESFGGLLERLNGLGLPSVAV